MYLQIDIYYYCGRFGLIRQIKIARRLFESINVWVGEYSFYDIGIDQGCQIFLDPNIPKWEKYTKWTQTKPNGHKLYQMAITYSRRS
jgi:hypothetical protein